MHAEPSAARRGPLERLLEVLSRLIPERHNTPRQYLYILGLTLLAMGSRLVIAPLEGGIQYVTFFPTVALSAVIGGLGPGLFSASIGVLLASWLFWPPYGELTLEFRYDMMLSNSVFLVDAILVCTAIEAMHRYYRRLVEAQRELQLAASVFHNSAEGVAIADRDGTIIAVNPAFSQITDYPPREALGQKSSLLHSHRYDAVFYRALWETLDRDGCWQGEVWSRRRNGEAFLAWLTVNRIDDGNGLPRRYVGVFHDITELRQRDDQIRHLAFHDVLTGLPNRLLLEDRLRRAVIRAQRDQKRLLVGFVDLDCFKAVNDTLGHEIGDLVLQEVARRMRGYLRESDTVARIGGDELVILLENVEAEDVGTGVAEGLIAAISQPMHLRGHEAHIGASVGIAYFPDHGADPQELLLHADAAMYVAKREGRNAARTYDPTLSRPAAASAAPIPPSGRAGRPDGAASVRGRLSR
jgi:diguanylate cyclase (GGDEF)-like protein/PAS domain S-box-containing protein